MTKPPLLRSPAEFADARARNEAIWNPSVEHYNAMRIDEALEYWHEESRWITAFPVAGMPRMVDSRAEMARVWRTLYVDTERVEVENVRFHQTDDPTSRSWRSASPRISRTVVCTSAIWSCA